MQQEEQMPEDRGRMHRSVLSVDLRDVDCLFPSSVDEER